MLNDYLSGEEARERIKQNIKDAELNNLLKRLGYNDHASLRWVIVLVVLGMAIGLLL